MKRQLIFRKTFHAEIFKKLRSGFCAYLHDGLGMTCGTSTAQFSQNFTTVLLLQKRDYDSRKMQLQQKKGMAFQLSTPR